ncbi:MAG: phosphoglucomutase/phosphomannomutase family protein [Chloroflexi bacterium]|nr:phosphoglucomutase/phosphomannomutase family protein [Chloroflexota bacterium]
MDRTIKFGTDGWRGIIAEDFTFDNVRICAQGVAGYLKETGAAAGGTVIGYDNRFASEDFAAAAAEVLSGNGIRVYLFSRSAPTPVISYAAVAKKASGAIAITASHNPPAWNGFKYKTGDGASAPTEVATRIEENIARVVAAGHIERAHLSAGLKSGLVERIDIAPLYLEHLKRLVEIPSLKKARLKVAIDPMYGSAIGYLRSLLDGGSLELIEINNHRNPVFPGMKQPEPIAGNLGALSAVVKEQRLDAGLATDGDADRFGGMDEHGLALTTLQSFALLCLYFLEVRQERGVLVKTLTQTSMVDRLGEMFGVPVRETKVGFKYIAPIMMAENALLGGEESGGYGYRGNIPERDGVLSSLYFLDLMVRTGKNPSQLVSYLHGRTGPHHFNRHDLDFPEEKRQEIVRKVTNSQPQALAGVRVVKTDALDGFRFVLEDGSWLLVRFSGTEPLLRIYAEAGSPGQVESLLEQGRKMAGL